MRQRSPLLAVPIAVIAVLVLLSSCSPDSTATVDPSTTVGTPSGTATASARPSCPNPEGRACLGVLAAGTYTTIVFGPQLTYTVPDGWSNFEDTPGNFLLVPPDQTLEGVNAATSDFIGVYTSVVSIEGCDSLVQFEIDTPAAFADWLAGHVGFAVSNVEPTTIGGLDGIVLDLRMAEGWTTTCPYSNGRAVVPLMAGSGPSSLDHNVVPGQVTRLYVLANQDDVLAIEVVDLQNAEHVDEYSAVVEDFVFG